MKRVLIVVAVAGVLVPAGSAAAHGRGWKWCHLAHHGSVTVRDVCSSGHAIFSWEESLNEQSGYRYLISGFRQTGPRSGIIDTRGDGYIIQGDPVDCAYANPPPPPEQCVYLDVKVRVRFATKNGGRRWQPVAGTAHKTVSITKGRDGTPQVWEIDVSTDACEWAHSEQREFEEGIGGPFGSYCSPVGLWVIAPPP